MREWHNVGTKKWICAVFFWQVGLTRRAQELTCFVTPSGRVFRWLVMSFGLQQASCIFQEMMELVCGKVKSHEEVKDVLVHGHSGAFF